MADMPLYDLLGGRSPDYLRNCVRSLDSTITCYTTGTADSAETDAIFPQDSGFEDEDLICCGGVGQAVNIDEKPVAAYPCDLAYLPVVRLKGAIM